MAFFTTQKIGRLYVLRIELPDSVIVHKIGICFSNRSVDRMMEILRSWFQKFRFVPYTVLKLDMECQEPEKLEKYIHGILNSNRFIPNHKVDGGTEMFIDINELRLIQFLKAYNNSMYVTPPELTNEQKQKICHLLTQ